MSEFGIDPELRDLLREILEEQKKILAVLKEIRENTIQAGPMTGQES